MNILSDKNKTISEIKAYRNPKWIWIEIWKMSPYEIQIVITVNEEESCHLGQHKAIHVCSAQTDNHNDIVELKKYGKSIVRLIRNNFPDSKVYSRLYYK